MVSPKSTIVASTIRRYAEGFCSPVDDRAPAAVEAELGAIVVCCVFPCQSHWSTWLSRGRVFVRRSGMGADLRRWSLPDGPSSTLSLYPAASPPKI